MKKTIFSFMVLVLLSSGLRAQSIETLLNSGVTASSPINDIRKITFSADSVHLLNWTGTSASSPVDSIRKHFFAGVTGEGLANAGRIALLNSPQLFPVPAGNEINYSFRTEKENMVQVEIINLTGSTVMPGVLAQVNSEELNLKLNLAQLPNGFYFVRTTTGDRIIHQPITIQR